MSAPTLPAPLRPAMRRAIRLSWWKLFWMATTIVVMGLAMGQSQAMQTAWIEDVLGLVPAIAFLIAALLEMRRGRSAHFPFGFERSNGLGFFVAAVALAAVGLLLLWDAGATLIAGERVTVGSIVIFGHTIWAGWVMVAAQAYSLIPPLIIGRLELPLAEELNDKLLHTDALMNKANWLTGAAGIAGVIGLGFGWWWADAAAAAIISIDIINDGVKALRSASAELIDGAPRGLSATTLASDARALKSALQKRFPDGDIRLRETGRVIRAEVHGVPSPEPCPDPADYWPGDPDRAWRLAQISFAPGGKSG